MVTKVRASYSVDVDVAEFIADHAERLVTKQSKIVNKILTGYMNRELKSGKKPARRQQ